MRQRGFARNGWRVTDDSVPALGAIPTLKWIAGSPVLVTVPLAHLVEVRAFKAMRLITDNQYRVKAMAETDIQTTDREMLKKVSEADAVKKAREAVVKDDLQTKARKRAG